ncbi:hypothetical protein ACNKHR_00635 [Shigella flexneri]
MLVVEIAERHAGPVVLIAPDRQNALRLHDEISQFTDQMVMGLADGKPSYDSFSPHQDIISSAFHPLPATDDAAWRTDCSGEYA